ncbi:hypothetical protein LCGC14_2030450 [marine sediment metagenome]|uniref:Uncharacterized protein n=1 Tax=marine sediment metagenome TaxID=412755 RepID=A0A0F9EV28_9ZZZZ
MINTGDYSIKEILENKSVFYEVCIDWMTMDGDEKAAEKLADWLGISLHALKLRWKRIFGYSLNKLINYNLEE